MIRSIGAALVLAMLASRAGGAEPPPGVAEAPVAYTSLTHDFTEFFDRTQAMPLPQRVAAFEAAFADLPPGFYRRRDRSQHDYDGDVAAALTHFPAIRSDYTTVQDRFGGDLQGAVVRFRAFFPGFQPQLPIYLLHSLGEMDGGTRRIDGQNVMIFGADVIPRYDQGPALKPFLSHELFHAQHAQTFSDCDPLWCSLWQEGMAVYAASLMNPTAGDAELSLDNPQPMRPVVDARWGEALCLTAAKFESKAPGDYKVFFEGGGHEHPFPPRFGYYVGLRIAQDAGKSRSLAQLTHMGHAEARELIVATLDKMIREAGRSCPIAPAAA